MAIKPIKEINLTQSDVILFESIYLDSLSIIIGKSKITQSKYGIYNQISSFFKVNGKKEKEYLLWLMDKYGCDKTQAIPPEIVQQYEKSLILRARSLIYIEAFRIKFNESNDIEFYGYGENSVLSYLCAISDSKFSKIILQYLQYNPVVDKICQDRKLEHCLDKSEREIINELKICLRNKLIPTVDFIKCLSNNKNHYSLAYYNLECGNANKATPAWDSFMASMSDNGQRECFRAWIYSIFKDDNFGRQVLWLYGRGNTGKSVVVKSITRRLAKLNPSIVAAVPSKVDRDKHTSSSFERKRFVQGPDTIDRALVRQQLIKNITGNDDTTVRAMNTNEKQRNIYAKVMVSSNQKPFVNTEKDEELSRILFIELDYNLCNKSKENWDFAENGDWANCITLEIDDFIAKCTNDFNLALDKDGHNIKPYPTMVEAIEQGDFFLKRDQHTWWNKCLTEFVPDSEKKKGLVTNILTLTQLCADFDRFMKYKKNHKYTRVSRGFMCTMLNEKKIPIKNLNANNESYIIGYEFIHPDPKHRITMEQYVLEEAERLCYNYVEEESQNVYGKM